MAPWSLVWITTLTFISQSGRAANESAKSIVAQADEARAPQKMFSMTVQVTDKEDGDAKTSTFRVYSKGNQFSLVEQLAPVRQVGRKLLMRGDDLWLFTPNVNRPTRISLEQKLTGEVSNGDLARTNFAEDYAATMLGEENISGRPCFKMSLEATRKSATYRKIVYWVEKATKFPVKAEFYALSGKMLKTAEYGEYKQVLGKKRMTRTLIVDHLQKTHSSEMVYSKHKLQKLDDTFFSKEALGN